MQENIVAKKFIDDRIKLYEIIVEGLEKKRLPIEITKKCALNLCEKIKTFSQNAYFAEKAWITQRNELIILCNRLQTIV